MAISTELMTGGLALEKDLVFPSKPTEPDMRESTSIWLFEENGEFAFPRIGIEGEAWSWDDRLYHANFALGGGRVLYDTGRGPVPSPIGPDGRPTVFGAGPLVFRCIDPFRKWTVSFDGTAVDSSVAEQIAQTTDQNKRTPVQFEIEITMVTPAWVHDYAPEKIAGMSEVEKGDASSMGIGYRMEHLFRGQGWLKVDGEKRDFKALGSRIHRQSVRPLDAFRGHCWQSAVFPDGRAFGFITYPPIEGDPDPYNEGYVYQDGKMYPARATKVPWLRRIVPDGEDVSVEIECELGTTRIGGISTLSTFKVNTQLGKTGFNLQQGSVRYNWDGQTSYGMIERSALGDQME